MAFKAFVFLLLALLLFTTGSSFKAPAYPPEKPPVAVHPPKPAPFVGPPAEHIHGCEAPCEEHCKEIHAREDRPCMRACMACCRKCDKCVPRGPSKCQGWDFVYIHKERVECP